MRKFTYALLLFFIGSLSFSGFRRTDIFFSSYAASQQDQKVARANKANLAFPVAEINEPEEAESAAGRSKKEKLQRYDAWTFVS